MSEEKLSNLSTGLSTGKPRGRNGGRKKGIPNKKTLVQAEEVAASGLTPLQYMLQVMRDETEDRPRRLYAANMAAPYVHAKLASIEHKGADGGPIKTESTLNIAGLSTEALAEIMALSDATKRP